jgi:hypothetical protein
VHVGEGVGDLVTMDIAGESDRGGGVSGSV